MPRHDYKCDRCGQVIEVSMHLADLETKADNDTIPCGECSHGMMHRQPAAPNFTVSGYNAKNGYSKE